MTRLKFHRPSAALVVATLALFVALGGGAYAVSKNSVGTKQLKGNSVTSKILKKNAVKSSDIKNEQVKGKDLKNEAVETKKLADGAVSSSKLGGGSVTSSKTSFYGVSAVENVTAAPSQAAAPEVTLLTRGPFTVYGKCFVQAAQIDAEVYIKTSEPGTLFSSNTDDKDGLSGAGTATGYLNPGTLEAERIIQDDADANANDADGVDQNENWFNATNGAIAIEGRVLNYAKQGTPTGGDGPFGAGNRCIFHAWFLNQA
jgi:hypothetical protein